jgi:hypothetical protein
VQTGAVASWGLSLEGSQTTYSARGAPANVLIGQAGGSLLNGTANYSADLAPDLIAKVALDPKGWGHWELKAVGSVLRDRFVDPTDVAGGTTMNNTFAGGVGFGVFFPVVSGGRDVVDLGLSGLTGKGIGRYGTTGLPDASLASDGSLQALNSSDALLSIEAHPDKNLDVYGYGGFEYVDRDSALIAGKVAGYGLRTLSNAGCGTEAIPTGPYAPAAGTCNADTRNFWQGDLGFWYRFYKGAAGTVQWGLQYSYTKRNTWSGLNGIQPSGTDNMIFSSFRYVLP